ncbi:hypothetical protein F53441_4140 [Fusarium austroafricanum]|uniref:Nephrocystin 3-like N-terminal domain-containing protein n=1 Tax=Fusarium austroafricanum TaxID=2364996 RepID=A0A8H4KNZ8_9HYPO|nr:hypothetical protein F53441_4140 [Fusarium austroafricanum]
MDPLSLAASIAGLLSIAGAVISAGYKLNSKLNQDTSDTKTLINETASFSGILLGVKTHLESFQSPNINLEDVFKTIEDSKGTLNHVDELTQMTEVMANLESLRLTQEGVQRSVGKLVDSGQVERQEKMIEWLGEPTETEHDDLCKQRDEKSAEWILNRDEFGEWLSAPTSSLFWLTGTRQLLKQHSNPRALLELVNELYEKHRRRSARPSLEDLQSLFTELSQYFDTIFLVIDGLDQMGDQWEILEFLDALPEVDVDFKVLIASRAGMGVQDAFVSYFSVTVTPQDVAPDIERFVRKQLGKRRFRGTEVENVIKDLVLRADGMFIWVICQIDHLSRVRTAISPSLVQALPRNLEKTFEQTFQRLEDEEERRLAKRILQFVMFCNKPLDLSELVEGIAVTAETKTLDDVTSNSLREKSYVFELCGSLIRESQATGKIELAHYSVFQFLQSSRLEGNRENDLYLDTDNAKVELLTACIRYLTIENISTGGIPEEVEAALDDDDLYVSPEVFANTPFLEHAVSNWPAYASSLSEVHLKDVWASVLLPFFQPSSKHFEFWTRKARYLHGYYKYPPGITPLHAAAVHGLSGLAKLLIDESSLSKAPSQPSEATTACRTPLHMAIENGQETMIEMLLGSEFSQSADERGRTPLHLALECANEKAVTQLVSAGAHVNRPEKDGRTPIFIAIENNWDGLAAHLAGMVSPYVTMPDGRGALHLAAQTGSTTWTSALLKSNPNTIDKVDDRGWSAMLYAVDRGHLDVVKILLASLACIGIRDNNGWTPLHAAMKQQRLDCATELLVSNNPRVPASGQQPGGRRAGRLSEAEISGKYGEAYRSSSSVGTTGGGSSWRSGNLPRPSGSASHPVVSISSPLFLAVSNNYKPGVELLLQHVKTYGHEDIGLSEGNGECLKASLSLPETTIFKKLLPVSTAKSILAMLPTIVSEGGRFQDIMRQRLDNAFIHTSLLPEALLDNRLTLELANTILDIWPPQTAKLPDNIIYLAAQRGDDQGLRLMTRLIDAGANTSYVDDEGRTPLHMAISHFNWEAASFLIKRLPFERATLLSALHNLVDLAPTQDNGIDPQILSILTLLLEKGVAINDVEGSQRSICHKAAGRADSAFLQWALENDTELVVPDSKEDTPITVAVASRQVDNLGLLLDAIIQTTPGELVVFLSTPGMSRGTPLMAAVDLSDIAILTKLIEADNISESLAGNSAEKQAMKLTAFTDALCNAIRKGFDQGAFALIEAMENISGYSSSGETPLHTAVQEENGEMVTTLLEYGAQLNAKHQKTGETPFTVAMLANLTNIKGILSKYEIEFQPEDIIAAAKAGDEALVHKVLASYPDDYDNQRKALFTARRLRQKNIEKALHESLSSRTQPIEIDGITRDVYGDTILHQVVRARNPEQVGSLARAGDTALLHAYDLGGDSALMLAIRMCHWSGAEALAAAGANVDEALDKALAEKCDLWVGKLQGMKYR